jgi:Mlc titration factor MtfA (ptsG expression regulator)
MRAVWGNRLRVEAPAGAVATRAATMGRMFGWLADRRRKKILKAEFPPAWTAILEKNVAAYELLDADEQLRLRQLVQVFLAE